jgi:hypothetical protein
VTPISDSSLIARLRLRRGVLGAVRLGFMAAGAEGAGAALVVFVTRNLDADGGGCTAAPGATERAVERAGVDFRMDCGVGAAERFAAGVMEPKFSCSAIRSRSALGDMMVTARLPPGGYRAMGLSIATSRSSKAKLAPWLSALAKLADRAEDIVSGRGHLSV